MSHSRVIICLHVLQGFYDGNNQLCINLKTVIFCAPARTSMAAFFCIFAYAVNVWKILRKKNLTRIMLITSA